ncbi:hypothetical protein GALMADRAFT_143137 [Galerina marginata CBS 339.88]|uniref:F-box domain-containing protein n=1 Tax=Galerina marginata (strain CBS 339.88) TaxID=685588 RepID=A0A067SX54_GALM3|nr:hypothetical protein GALMADRAFT_143137 [Galerina marginata CBS 339.88]
MVHSEPIPSSCRSAPSPAIFKLDDDVLMYVFSLNADMELETEERVPALLTLRHTSQVCTDWRTLATGSPTLWARLLDLRLLLKASGAWRDDVLRRTGTALLRVKGYQREHTWRAEPWHSRMVNENWDRLQSLDLSFTSMSQGEGERWLSIFQRPVSTLEIFRVSWPSNLSHNFELFSKEAPLLQTLSMRYLKQNILNLSFPNIRNFRLTSHESVSAPAFLDAISQMPLLEKLDISTCFIPGESSPKSLPLVSLPQLTKISFYDRHGTGANLLLLAHLVPANGCNFSFFGSYDGRLIDDISRELLHDILSTYSTYCTELENSTTLDIKLRENNIHLRAHRQQTCPFHIHIDWLCNNLPKHTIPNLLSSLKTLQIGKITEITLTIEDPDLLSNPGVVAFILSLVSVETLRTAAPTLRSLSVIQSNQNVVILPALQMIDLDASYLLFLDTRELLQLSFAKEFLTSRIGLGAPVITLMIRGYQFPYLNNFFNEVPGLTVKGDGSGSLW